MSTEIDRRLQQLIAIWRDGDSATIRDIPVLCDEIGRLAAHGQFESFDRNLLNRVTLLSVKAEQRLATCVEILSRTGSYSTRGALELSPHVGTTGWEG